MKDLYTFDIDHRTALETYDDVTKAYNALFTDLGLPFVVAQADSGVMGGNLSHEYHYLSPDGEDTVHVCGSCGYAVNDEAVDPHARKPDADGIPCPKCPEESNTILEPKRAIEVGHTFNLGTRYSRPLGATVTIGNVRRDVHMGCHGIGVTRLMAAVAAQLSDPKGLAWPRVIAPFDVAILPKAPVDSPDWQLVERAYEKLQSVRVLNVGGAESTPDVAVDDRKGKRSRFVVWKMNEADVIGYPIVLVVPGREGNDSVEIQCRRLGMKEIVNVEELAPKVEELLAKL